MNQRFEDYIKDYDSNFFELSKYASSKSIVEKYYSTTKGSYKKYFDEKDDLDIEKFAIRYYRAKKEMYNSSHNMLLSPDTSIRLFFLSVSASDANIFYPSEEVFHQSSHDFSATTVPSPSILPSFL